MPRPVRVWNTSPCLFISDAARTCWPLDVNAPSSPWLQVELGFGEKQQQGFRRQRLVAFVSEHAIIPPRSPLRKFSWELRGWGWIHLADQQQLGVLFTALDQSRSAVLATALD